MSVQVPSCPAQALRRNRPHFHDREPGMDFDFGRALPMQDHEGFFVRFRGMSTNILPATAAARLD